MDDDPSVVALLTAHIAELRRAAEEERIPAVQRRGTSDAPASKTNNRLLHGQQSTDAPAGPPIAASPESVCVRQRFCSWYAFGAVDGPPQHVEGLVADAVDFHGMEVQEMLIEVE